eukprot:Awhi_evm1s10016
MWITANKLHLSHSIALLALPLVKRPMLVGGLMSSGMIIFSTSVYLTAATEDKSYGKVAPFG